MTEALRRLRTDADLRRHLAEGARSTALRYDAGVIAPQLGGWLSALHDGKVPSGSITPSAAGGRPQMRPANVAT